MSVELTTFHDGDKTFLAVGQVTYQKELDYPYHAQRADGEEDWFFYHSEAIDFIAKGLKRPTQWTMED